MTGLVVLLLTIIWGASSAWAQSSGLSPGTDADNLRRSTGLALQSAGPRTSPFDPPPKSDTQFSVDYTPGELDTVCTFQSSGPLEFAIEITRWVGPVDSEGRLLDASALIKAGVLSPTATLLLPVFDVDVNGAPGDPSIPPEVDRISLNGKVLGMLTGDNNVWKLNQFIVDITDLRFPDRASHLGDTPTPARNTIRIDIDTASGGAQNWCTALDWAALSFKAFSPVILIHGNNSGAGFWDRHNFSAALYAASIPFDGCAIKTLCQNPINLPTASIEKNGKQLKDIIPHCPHVRRGLLSHRGAQQGGT